MSMTAEEKIHCANCIAEMQRISDGFYSMAVKVHNHPFIEFTGLMNEYIRLCEIAFADGIDFTMASTHTGIALPAETYHIDYIAEKFDCIFGPTLANEKLRKRFSQAMDWK